MSVNPTETNFRRLGIVSGYAAGAAFLFCILVGCLWPRRFFPSYLMGFLFWMGLPMGSLPLLMLYHLVGGRWGGAIRPFLEASVGTLPLMAILLVPIAADLHFLYFWSATATPDVLLAKKIIYLNGTAFVLRMVIILAICGALGFFLLHWSRRLRSTSEPEVKVRLRRLSGPGLVLYVIAATFACIDWVMTLEPDWYSSIFPVIMILGEALCALAFSTILLLGLGRTSREEADLEIYNQLGDLLLTFVMLWAYMTFAQLLIIYAGNLPHEISWYLRRLRGGWIWVAWAIILLQFGFPFFLLLFRTAKRSARILGSLAGILIGMQMICIFWYVAPSFRPKVSLDWFDPIVFVGIGAAWSAVFVWRLSVDGTSPRKAMTEFQ